MTTYQMNIPLSVGNVTTKLKWKTGQDVRDNKGNTIGTIGEIMLSEDKRSLVVFWEEW